MHFTEETDFEWKSGLKMRAIFKHWREFRQGVILAWFSVTLVLKIWYKLSYMYAKTINTHLILST